MWYSHPLTNAVLLKRYKRFLVDVLLPSGETLTVHCPNSGSMAGLLEEGNPVRISGPHGAHRKLRFTLEQIRIRRPDGRRVWVGVNTSIPNVLAEEAARLKRLPGLHFYTEPRREVKLGERSRIDMLLSAPELPPCWVEVKNVTLVQEDTTLKLPVNTGTIAAFPDAVTARGRKHLLELADRVHAGERAVMLYVVQRGDAESFAPAVGFDPEYSRTLQEVVKRGVEVIAMRARVSARGVFLRRVLPTVFDGLAGN
ncbi:DNA/RNA nuclease SfsA [bacterium]|nr:DNA/RNA nuclease SfsA [bacterium]